MKQAVIYVADNLSFNSEDLSNAVYLCKSITETPIVLWGLTKKDDRLHKEMFKNFCFISRSEKTLDNSDLLKTLDTYSLQDEVVIVSIGSTEDVNRYLYNRVHLEESPTVCWNILSSNYARYSLLQRQRSLSDYIPVDTKEWVQKLVEKFGSDYIFSCLDEIKKSQTIIVGESILDEYIYCEALGKVSKDPIVAFHTREKVRQVGGVLAAAKHFTGLGSPTTVISELGKTDIDFALEKFTNFGELSYDVSSKFSSIVKTRFVDRSSGVRVFETYDLPVNYNNESFHRKLEKFLEEENLKNVNFVVMDYGHDLLSNDSVKLLLNSGIELSVNTQSNAGNRGFNSIARYKGAQKAFLNGGEVQLEARNKHSDLSVIVQDLAQRLEFKEIYVTNGSRGIIAVSSSEGQYVVPAFAPTVIDRVGAGDATLAVISALRAVDTPIEISAFYGNIAGALLVSTIGNEITITKTFLKKEAESIVMKVL